MALFHTGAVEVAVLAKASALGEMGSQAAISIAPEFGVAVAFKQWQDATSDLAAAKRQHPEYQDRLTLAHAFAVNMGAILVYDVASKKRVGLKVDQPMPDGEHWRKNPSHEEQCWSWEQGVYARLSRSPLPCGNKSKGSASPGMK